VAASLAAGACEQSPTCVQSGCNGSVPVWLAVSPATLSIPVGAQARAYALLSGVPSDAPRTVSWAITDTVVAAVVQARDTAGLLTVIVAGRTPGVTMLVAHR